MILLMMLTHYTLDLSDVDATEAEKVSSFFTTGCGFKMAPTGTCCSSLI